MPVHKRLLSVLITACVLLLAACGQNPAASAEPDPGDIYPEEAAGLYTGPYEDNILPMSVPNISEADMAVFNPSIIFDYLATSPLACHDYKITGWKAAEGKLYLVVSDTLYFDDPNDAYFYIKDAFALTDDTLLKLPVFSKCRLEDGWITLDSSLDFTGYSAKNLESVPVAEDAFICLPDNYDPEIDTVSKFIDEFVNGRYKNSGVIGPVTFICGNGRITEIYPAEENVGEDYEGDDGTDVSLNFPAEVVSPRTHGFGSLPKALLGIKPVSTKSFDPDKAADYLLADGSDFQDCYWVDSAELKNGKLYLRITDSISIDANTAYRYFKTKFNLSDDYILGLPMFLEGGCALYGGKMYTPDGWELENGTEPDNYDKEYNYNCISLEEITLPEPVPVADGAVIILVDIGRYFTNEDESGCTITTKQFQDYLLGKSAEDNLYYLNNLWFKYVNDEITGIAEQYIP